MAKAYELAERLYKRFKGVPAFTEFDAVDLVEDALQVHGLEPAASIPTDNHTIILLYAQMNGARQVAMSVAHYFKYQDGEESVDKSMVAENYRKLANDLQAEYNALKSVTVGGFYTAQRVDRPFTTPATGYSAKRRYLR